MSLKPLQESNLPYLHPNMSLNILNLLFWINGKMKGIPRDKHFKILSNSEGDLLSWKGHWRLRNSSHLTCQEDSGSSVWPDFWRNSSRAVVSSWQRSFGGVCSFDSFDCFDSFDIFDIFDSFVWTCTLPASAAGEKG